MRNVLQIPVNGSVIFPRPWIWTGYFSSLTGSVYVWRISFDVQLQVTWRFQKRKWMSIDIYNFLLKRHFNVTCLVVCVIWKF
jgi:hypothetical protein